MAFDSVGDIETLLRSPSVSARDLHAMWTRRLAVPDPDERKKTDGTSAAQIAWLQQDIALARCFTEHALAQEEFLLVCDAAREIKRLRPANESDKIDLVRVRMHYAAALTRLGSPREGRDVLGECLSDKLWKTLGRRLQVDILLELGNILREESVHAAAKAAQLQTGQEALSFYRRALEIEPERLEALNVAAAAAFYLGEEGSPLREEARRRAHDVLALADRLENEEGPSRETTWVRATSLTVLGKVEEAARTYERLQTVPDITTTQLADYRFWTQFLAEALGRPRNLFKPAFPPLQLIVFSGHLPDRPDRPDQRVRMPPESIGQVRETLKKQLDDMQARVGLVSGSAGADLLFIEGLRARQATVHLVLPWSQEEFRRTSIRPYERADRKVWEPLFDEAVAHAATIREIGQVFEPSGDVGWEYLTEVTAGIALNTARASRLDLKPMVLWDGQSGRSAGGTDSFYDFWAEQLREEPTIISPPGVDTPGDRRVTRKVRSRRCERPAMHQEVKSMLFADIVGYSKLTEKVIPDFVGIFLERVSRLTASSNHRPCNVNTWGDAVYAVFDFAHDAGMFALELTQMIEEGRKDWLDKGLYWEEAGKRHPLNIRIGLHAGPVLIHYDPVVRRLGFTGSHVSRAARIEPVAKPGEVYASEEFAALAELGSEIERRRRAANAAAGGAGNEGSRADEADNEGFGCEYAGTMQLAKGYPGRYRIYRIVPKRVLALEDLAKAAHEGYCAESRARGDTPLTNAALRSWEDLSEDLRQANRASVADIPNKLRVLGYELAPGHGIHPSEIAITDSQVEELAMAEHERWMAERIRSGWTFDETRDNARRLHPLLVPWDRLTEKDKEKDRDTIRNLPTLVDRAGFRVRKIG